MKKEIVVDREDVHAQPWVPFGAYTGVRQKILWRDAKGTSYAGLLRLDPGAHVPPHAHHDGVHHAWVVAGVCGMGGEALGPESYSYVPAGTEHELLEVGLEGCTVFYLYLRT